MATIYYPPTITFDPAKVFNDYDPGYGNQANALDQDLTNHWTAIVNDIGSAGTNIDFNWTQSVNSFVNGASKGFAKSAILHFDYAYKEFPYDWDITDADNYGCTTSGLWSECSPPGLDLQLLWPNFPKFTSEGLFPNQTLISGPTFNDWTINCDHFVDPDIPNTNGPVMRLSVPLDLTLDDIIPKLRIRLYDHLGLGVTTQIYLKIYGVYLEIDWQANHGLTPVWAPPSTNVGYPILSTDEFNPTTGVYSGPTVGHPVALKMWGNPADANSRGILSLITEHH